MPQPKPSLSKDNAKRTLNAMFRNQRIKLLQQGITCVVFINDESEARFSGNDWDEVLEAAAKEKYSK